MAEQATPPPARRRRITPRLVGQSSRKGQDCDATHLQRPVLRLRELGGEGAEEVLFEFQNTRASEVRRVDTVADLHALLSAEASNAVATAQSWVRQPHARWITDMASELSPARRARLASRHRQLRGSVVPAEDTAGRWMDMSDFASFVVHLWFEEGRSLDEVLARAEALGHMRPGLGQGCILEGDFIKRLSTAKDVGFAGLMSMVRPMSARDGFVSLYKVCAHNCFEQEQSNIVRVDKVKPGDGQGSLNTTWDFGQEELGSGVDLIDEFYELLDESLDACDAVQLNRRIYLIWKFQNYVTSYHQDTHVPPHFTIYNQVSGYSVFHFLPLLVGLFVTYLGRADPLELQKVLGQLDQMGIGSLGTLGPDRVALILPFGAHGVWVPSTMYNATLRPFEVSLIRAAELYVRPLLEGIEEDLRGKRWNRVLELSVADRAQVRAFVEAQEALCEDMVLSKSEWAWLASETWEAWTNEEDQAGGIH